MDQIRFGTFLKALRKEKGLTQEQLAEKLNVSGRTVSRWETGSNMPDISLLAEIAEFYDVSIPELIDGERKSGEMQEEVKEVAGKMADYAGTEKAAIIKNIRLHSMFGVCALVILMILEYAVPEGSGSRAVEMLRAYCGTLVYVSLIMIFMISTGLLRKIQMKQKETNLPRPLWLIISMAAGVAAAVGLKYLLALLTGL